MQNKANLKPFENGTDNRRNLNGAPKGKRLSTLLREMLEGHTPDEIAKAKFMTAFYTGKRKPTNGHAYAARLLKAGIIDGEGWAIKEIADRIEGKAIQGLEVGGIGGGPIETVSTIVIQGVAGTDGPISNS